MTLKIGETKRISETFSEKKFSFVIHCLCLRLSRCPPRKANVSERWSFALVSLGGNAGHVRGSMLCMSSFIYLFLVFLCRPVDDVAFVNL